MVYIFGCMQLIKALKLSSSTIYVIIFLFFTCLRMSKTTTANEQLTSKLNNSANKTQIPTKFPPTLFKQRSLEGQYKDSSNAEATPVQLKACCGTKCKNFENLISMVGVECCGTTPANLIQNICCKNTLHERRSGSRYFDRCCSEIPYASDQTCCEGKVYEGIGLACCGSAAYNLHDKKKICCDRELYTIPSSFITTACCGNMLYNAWDGNEFCCGNKIYSRKFSNACCVWDGQSDKEAEDAQGYNLNTEICCNGVHDRKLFDSCCYVPDLSGPGFCEPQTSKLPNRMITAVELRDHLNTLSSGFLTAISKGCWSKGAGFGQEKLKPNSETTSAAKLPAVQCKQAEEAMNRLLRGEILGGRESDEEEPCENACSFFRSQLSSIGHCVAAMCEAWSAIEACLCPDDLKYLFELIRDLRNLYLYYNTLAEQITHNQRVEMTCELRCNFFHRFSEELTWPAQRCWNKLLELLPVDVGEQLTSGVFSEFEKKLIKVTSDVGSFTEAKNLILPLLRFVEAPNRLELLSRAKRLLQLVDERKSRLLSEICFLSTADANGSSETIYLEPNPLKSLQRVGTNLQHVLRLCCGSSVSSERIKLATESSVDGLLEIFATKSGLDVEQLTNWHKMPIRLAFIRGTVLCLHQWIADEARSVLKDLPRSNSQAAYESLCLTPTRCFFASAIFGHVTKLMAAVISVKFGFPYNLITDSEDKNNEIYYLKKIVAEQKQILAMKEAQRSDLEKQLKKLKDLNEKNIETVMNAATELVKENTKNYECKLKALKIEHEQAFIEERTATSRAIEVLKQQFDVQLRERLKRCRVDSSETETNNIQTKEFTNLLDHFAKLSLEYNKILIEKTALEQQLYSCGVQKIKTNSSNNGSDGIQLELIKEDCDEQMDRFSGTKSKNNATKKTTTSKILQYDEPKWKNDAHLCNGYVKLSNEN